MPDRVRCSCLRCRCLAGQNERLGPRVLACGNLLHGAPGGDRTILLGDRIAVLTGICVAVLDQKPVVAAAAVALAILPHAHQHPAALQFLAGNGELQLALAKSASGVARDFRVPQAPIPYHDGAAAILPLRDRAFKVTIVEWMILDLDGQAAIARAKGGPLRNGPGFENAIHLQPQIVMEPGGGVLLNNEAGIPGWLDLRSPARLRGDREVALGLVERELAGCHRDDNRNGAPRVPQPIGLSDVNIGTLDSRSRLTDSRVCVWRRKQHAPNEHAQLSVLQEPFATM